MSIARRTCSRGPVLMQLLPSAPKSQELRNDGGCCNYQHTSNECGRAFFHCLIEQAMPDDESRAGIAPPLYSLPSGGSQDSDGQIVRDNEQDKDDQARNQPNMVGHPE